MERYIRQIKEGEEMQILFKVIFFLIVIIWHTIGFFVGLFTLRNPFKYAGIWAEKNSPFHWQ